MVNFHLLRYILFHHQTTTGCMIVHARACCVISSFITKPQLYILHGFLHEGCVISSFITKPQLFDLGIAHRCVALYPLSSPNHNSTTMISSITMLRYILFHHQTTTYPVAASSDTALRYILFHHQTTTNKVFGYIPR